MEESQDRGKKSKDKLPINKINRWCEIRIELDHCDISN